jgi:Xaa-Pro dipeptidase
MPDPRLAPLGAVLEAECLDAVALVPGSTFRRLLGRDFHQNERPLVVIRPRAGEPVAVVPALELASFATLGFSGAVFDWRDEAGYDAAFAAAGRALRGLARIGVEGQRMRVFEAQALERGLPGAVIVDAQRPIAALRLRKTADEVAALRAAIAVSERALEATLGEVRVGMSETEVESILLGRLFAAGAEALAFAPIVAAGDNAAQPHAKARPDYRIKSGDALLLDFGASARGYNADITRTVFVGHVPDGDRALYEAVAAANAAGRAAARPGITAGGLDDVVQRSLEASPFARFIRHKTGHGLGLDVHEDPYIMRGNDMVLEPGMVFTVEPGLYRPGEIGVRIEDDVLVTETGAESLTTFPRELRVVG